MNTRRIDTSLSPEAVSWQPRHGAGDDRTTIGFDATSARDFDCPLDWLGGDFSAEHWRLGSNPEYGRAHGWRYAKTPTLALAATHVALAKVATPARIQAEAERAYQRLFALQRTLGLAYPQRVWHWLADVTAGTGDDQRYQRFCRGRSQALDARSWSILPPATLVGSGRPGLRMHALLAATPVKPIENPRQISAYRYPRIYGVRAPAFARAGVARLGASRYLLISGTASIVGHASRHIGDTSAQVDESLANVDAVVTHAASVIGRRDPRELDGLRAYVRRAVEADTIERRLRAALPAVPIALLHAPLCREDLAVEVEALMRVD